MAMKITVKKKYKIGTPMILLVLARKSAEASITLIAVLKDENPHQMASMKMQANIDRTIPAAR